MRIKQIADTQRQLDALSRNPLHFSGGVFTHSTTISVGTGFTHIPWDTDVVTSGIDWNVNRNTFTVNSAGMYLIHTSVWTSAGTNLIGALYVNGTQTMVGAKNYFTATDQAHSHHWMYYFEKNDSGGIYYQAGTAVSLQNRVIGTAWISPYLFITQISPKIH